MIKTHLMSLTCKKWLSIFICIFTLSCQKQDLGSSVQSSENATSDSGISCPNSPTSAIDGIQNLLKEVLNQCQQTIQKIPGAASRCQNGCLVSAKKGIGEVNNGIVMSLNATQSSNSQQRLAVRVSYTLPSSEKWNEMSCENPLNSSAFNSSVMDYLKIQCESVKKTGQVDNQATLEVKSDASALEIVKSEPLSLSVLSQVQIVGKCGLDLKNAVLQAFEDKITKMRANYWDPTQGACPSNMAPQELRLQMRSSNSDEKPTIFGEIENSGTLKVGFELLGNRHPRPMPNSDKLVCVQSKSFVVFIQFEEWFRNNWKKFLADANCPIVDYP